MFSLYYQAHVIPVRTYYLVALLRSYDHLAFDRTLNPEQGIMEFFVPPANQQLFEAVMQLSIELGFVTWFSQNENRLAQSGATLESTKQQ